MARPPLLRMRTSIDIAARARINATKLVDRLQAYIDTDDYEDPDDLVPKKGSKKPVRDKRRMTHGQVTAALGLIKKSIPDLAAVQISGDDENPVIITEIRRTIVDPKEYDDKD